MSLPYESNYKRLVKITQENQGVEVAKSFKEARDTRLANSKGFMILPSQEESGEESGIDSVVTNYFNGISKGNLEAKQKIAIESNKLSTTKNTEKIADNLLDFVISFEGFNANAYEDYGQLSVGYGSAATGKDQTVTEEEARVMLKNDLKKARSFVMSAAKRYGYTFTSNQINALTSFTQNLGPGDPKDIEKGGLEQLLNGGTRGIEEISDAMELYNKAGGKVLEGLVKRRSAEYKLFNEGF